MPSSIRKLFVIGARPHGVVVVRTQPARIIHITHEEIDAYAQKNPGLDAYAHVESILTRLIFDIEKNDVLLGDENAQGIERSIEQGFILAKAEFAAVIEIKRDVDEVKTIRRRSYNPLGKVLDDLDPSETDLEGLIFSEIDPSRYP